MPQQEVPVRPVIQRKWKKDKRMQSGGYWYVPKNRQNSSNGIREERASPSERPRATDRNDESHGSERGPNGSGVRDAGMPSPSGPPIVRGPLLASNFPPQVSEEVPSPEAARPGEPGVRDQDDGAVQEQPEQVTSPHPENVQAPEEGEAADHDDREQQDLQEQQDLFGEHWDQVPEQVGQEENVSWDRTEGRKNDTSSILRIILIVAVDR